MSLTDSPAVDIARTASLASRQLATLPTTDRNDALTALHDALSRNRDFILDANAKDVAIASQAANNGSLSHSVLKRLDLSRPGKYDDMLKGILSVRDLEDPGVYMNWPNTHHINQSISGESDPKDATGRWSHPGESELSYWRLAYNIRGPS